MGDHDYFDQHDEPRYDMPRWWVDDFQAKNSNYASQKFIDEILDYHYNLVDLVSFGHSNRTLQMLVMGYVKTKWTRKYGIT